MDKLRGSIPAVREAALDPPLEEPSDEEEWLDDEPPALPPTQHAERSLLLLQDFALASQVGVCWYPGCVSRQSQPPAATAPVLNISAPAPL